MSNKRPKRKSRRYLQAAASKPTTTWRLDTAKLLMLTVLVAAVYCLYSLFSKGLYQHDEAAHFLNMRTFWHDPNAILGNWAKTGYKILFVPIALLGPTAVLIANCLVSAFCCYFAYRLAETLNSDMPLLAFIFLGYRNFSYYCWIFFYTQFKRTKKRGTARGTHPYNTKWR